MSELPWFYNIFNSEMIEEIKKKARERAIRIEDLSEDDEWLKGEDMTNGELFIKLFQPFAVKQNGSAMWIWMKDYNGTHYAMPTEWWNAPYGEEWGNYTDERH